RCKRPGAYDVSRHTYSRHRRPIGIVVPVPVVALIHWNCPGSESQRGERVSVPRQRRTFASGCRGEFENPALRFDKEYTLELALAKAGKNLRDNSVSKVSTVSGSQESLGAFSKPTGRYESFADCCLPCLNEKLGANFAPSPRAASSLRILNAIGIFHRWSSLASQGI